MAMEQEVFCLKVFSESDLLSLLSLFYATKRYDMIFTKNYAPLSMSRLNHIIFVFRRVNMSQVANRPKSLLSYYGMVLMVNEST